MLRIRIKMGPQQRNKEWTCCFGLHVHTATIMIGLWHLFLNILALSLLAVIWRNPHMMEELESGYDYTVDLSAPALPTPLSKVDPPYPYRDHSLNYRKQYQNFDMGGLVCTCMIAITLMMIYGTLKGKPSHLLPFFCLQLFDFAITTLTAAGYICYLQAIHRLIAESHRLPWREKLLEMSQEELMVIVLVVFICIVFLKAYAIGVVWRCYKYLTLRQQNLRTLLPCVMPELGGAGLVGEERAYTTLLPNYDEAIAQYMKQAPPPSYQVAMSNYQRVDAEVDAANNVVAAGAAVVTADDTMDNNNDTPNNNNTVHVNANTPPMRRNEASVGAESVETVATAPTESDNIAAPAAAADTVRATGELTPPPPYINGAIRVTVGNGEPRLGQPQSPQADNRNESQA
ncbi:lysosomal-associated transmembrane protein 4A [Rhagoletis pomonella]|uniref:lysosomal-associated transmembrane protein 4A n=1 Tax=Rhagoletis pomonella TaxID=28610 RepID=UPI00177CF361|nr:lysosomal-associated transmembrane protein 4A [Rhagoletis pomonella]